MGRAGGSGSGGNTAVLDSDINIGVRGGAVDKGCKGSNSFLA